MLRSTSERLIRHFNFHCVNKSNNGGLASTQQNAS